MTNEVGAVAVEMASAGHNALPFASTGPAGHRGRMRERLLARGGDGLADYEVLEMLLFIGVPRGDTKPLAKALINRFGGLAGVLAATPAAIHEASGLALRAILPLRLVAAAAERLARGDAVTRPVLGSLPALEAYLTARDDPAGAMPRALFLDNRNRLLADEASAVDVDPADAASVRAVLKRALAVHATALVLADRGDAATRPDRARGEAAGGLKRAASLLSVVMHDRVLLTPDGLVSYRRGGLLR